MLKVFSRRRHSPDARIVSHIRPDKAVPLEGVAMPSAGAYAKGLKGEDFLEKRETGHFRFIITHISKTVFNRYSSNPLSLTETIYGHNAQFDKSVSINSVEKDGEYLFWPELGSVDPVSLNIKLDHFSEICEIVRRASRSSCFTMEIRFNGIGPASDIGDFRILNYMVREIEGVYSSSFVPPAYYVANDLFGDVRTTL